MTKKLNEHSLKQIKAMLENGYSIQEVAEEFNVTPSHVYLLLRREKSKRSFLQKVWDLFWEGKI